MDVPLASCARLPIGVGPGYDGRGPEDCACRRSVRLVDVRSRRRPTRDAAPGSDVMARTCRLLTAILPGALAWLVGGLAERQLPEAPHRPVVINASELAQQATIRRDSWGVPHIEGPTDESVVFAFAYAQAEDFFWQVEDTYILGLGRYAEAHGPRGLNSDLLNRAFEIVARSRNASMKRSSRN